MISKTHFFSLLICLFLIVSCSDDDTNTDGPNGTGTPATNTNYFPTNLDSYWNYDVEINSTATTNPEFSTDQLTVASIDNSSFTLSANNGLPPNGTMSGILISGTLANTNSTLSLNGVLGLPAELADIIDFDITLNNAILYDTTAPNNSVLFTMSDQVTQDIQGIPLTLAYEVQSTGLNVYDTITLNGETYTNVVASEITLNLGAVATYDFNGFPISIDVLDPQDLLIVTSYYAENIGLVHAESQFDYEINATALAALANIGVNLTIPPTGSGTNVQVLNSYGPQ